MEEDSAETNTRKEKFRSIITTCNKEIKLNSLAMVQFSFEVSEMINFGNISKVKMILKNVMTPKRSDRSVFDTTKNS